LIENFKYFWLELSYVQPTTIYFLTQEEPDARRAGRTQAGRDLSRSNASNRANIRSAAPTRASRSR
jgi:hypothetical protein